MNLFGKYVICDKDPDLTIDTSHTVEVASTMIDCFPEVTWPIRIACINNSYLGYVLCSIALSQNPDLTTWRAIETYAHYSPPGIVDKHYISELYTRYGLDTSLQPQCCFFPGVDVSTYVKGCVWSTFCGFEMKRAQKLTLDNARLLDPTCYRVIPKLNGIQYVMYKPPKQNSICLFGKNNCKFTIDDIIFPGEGKTILYGRVRQASRYDANELTFDIFEVVALDNNFWLSTTSYIDRMSLMRTFLSAIRYGTNVKLRLNVVESNPLSQTKAVWDYRVDDIFSGLIFQPDLLHMPVFKWEPMNTVNLLYNDGKLYCNGRSTSIGKLDYASDHLQYKVVKCTYVSEKLFHFLRVAYHLIEPDNIVTLEAVCATPALNLETICNIIAVRDRTYVPLK
ncbi:hypothetical protein [Scale drop disease virus]|uniref:ORF_094L n=1 Tax=Scale drop disease virus TaxID=1697349 RepID=A0A0K1L6K1_9VIRU|nr:ORF_094L [Scale drop disease virus]AKU37509.1 ORF_094L [Scale drop disease virus]QLI60768.1 hypothetical protein [Scale drop disease virus]QXJ13686.1 ORF094L [Scale drop disease virus]UNH60687.1 hypothetical protein SDDV_ORF018 [Scale drop disease virus]